MTDEELKKFERTAQTAELGIESKIQRNLEKIKKEEIWNSITHLEISLEKFLKSSTIHELDNVYYHIGAIKAAAK